MERKRKLSDSCGYNNDAKRLKYSCINIVSIEQLPVEVLSIILNYIKEDKYRKIVRLVNAEWFRLIDHSRFRICNSRITDADGEDLIRLFGRYEKPISLSFPMLSTKLPFWRFTNLVELRVPYLDIDDSFMALTKLTALTINDIASDKKMATLTQMTNLRALRAFSLWSNNLHLPNLVSLEYQHMVHHSDTFNVYWPLLTRLYAPWDQLISPKHAFNLKCLTVLSEYERSPITRKCYTGLEALVSRNIMFDDLPLSLTRLEFSYATSMDQAERISQLTNLKELLIDVKCSNINISAMTKLESFRLIDSEELMVTSETPRANQFLEQICPQNLTRLEFILENRKQMNIISRLTALQRLTLREVEEDVWTIPSLRLFMESRVGSNE